MRLKSLNSHTNILWQNRVFFMANSSREHKYVTCSRVYFYGGQPLTYAPMKERKDQLQEREQPKTEISLAINPITIQGKT
jgi:hypothetical protein